MLELPGITSSGDAGADIQKILRYLARLVPQLEMELEDARADRYQEEMNALTQHVGAVNAGTTAGALAAHELRRDNPHKVTAAQLGLNWDQLVQTAFAGTGLAVRIGEKKGLQINVQDVQLTVREWQQHGGVCYADVDLGEWDAVIPVPYAVIVTAGGGVNQDYWIGPRWATGTDVKLIGRARIYHECDISVLEGAGNDGTVTDERVIPLTIIGLGVYGYGD